MLCTVLALAGCAHAPAPAGVTVLSAGAVEPGLLAALAEFEKDTGSGAAVTFSTAPQIRERVARGERFDLVIVPPAMMDGFAKEGRVAAERAMLGRVGQGIAVRPGLPVPDVSVYGEIERKTVRYDNAAQVMDHLLKGQGSEIGFSPITEIVLYAKKGLRYAGPLPAEVQQRNAYVASAMREAANAEAAASLMRFLATPRAKAALAAGGVD